MFFDNLKASEYNNLVGSTVKQYNSHNWNFTAQLLNVQTQQDISLLTLSINLVIIDNNIECYSPTIQLTYFDLGQSITKAVNTNNLFIKIDFTQPSPNPQDPYWDLPNKLRLQGLFSVYKVLVLFKNHDNIMYKFHGIHYNYNYLLKTTNYATTKQNLASYGTPLSPLLLINKILKQIDYPHDTFFNDTKNKVNFISSQKMNIKDCIDYLLRRTPSKLDPPSYFVHNLMKNKSMLINSKVLLLRLSNPINSLTLVGGTPPISDQTTYMLLLTQISDITNLNFNGGVIAGQYLGKFDFHDYDHNQRKWTTTTYTYPIIDKIFNKHLYNINGNYRTVFPILKYVLYLKFNFAFPNFKQPLMYLFLRELQISTDRIRFNVAGCITRDAGQYVNINCTDLTQLPLYGGLWHIYSCRHTWTSQIYTNQLICYRTAGLKPQWEKTNAGTVY